MGRAGHASVFRHFRGRECTSIRRGGGTGASEVQSGDGGGIPRLRCRERDLRLGNHLLAVVEGILLLINILVVPVHRDEQKAREKEVEESRDEDKRPGERATKVQEVVLSRSDVFKLPSFCKSSAAGHSMTEPCHPDTCLFDVFDLPELKGRVHITADHQHRNRRLIHCRGACLSCRDLCGIVHRLSRKRPQKSPLSSLHPSSAKQASLV